MGLISIDFVVHRWNTMVCIRASPTAMERHCRIDVIRPLSPKLLLTSTKLFIMPKDGEMITVNVRRQISSSQWKKFIEAGRLPSSERFQTELWKSEPRERSRSQQQQEPSSPRKTEHKKLNTTESGKRSKVYTESETGERRQPAKGVPASFGYVKKNMAYPGLDVKRSDSSAGNGKVVTYKTANVATVPKLMEEHHRENSVPANQQMSLERPKTRLKVSGGTQTDLGGGRTLKPSQYKPPPTSTATQLNQPCGSFSDSEYQTSNGNVKFTLPMAPPANVAGKTNQQTGFKSYSLTAPIANQLSHNIRERLLLNGTQSLPKSHFNHINARGNLHPIPSLIAISLTFNCII